MKNIVRHIFSVLLCGTLLPGCMKDDTQTPAAVKRDILQLSVPGQATVSVYSTEDENECRLFNYWMLVFRSGALVHKQTEASVAPTANGTTSPSIVLDSFQPAPGDMIYVVANAPAGLTFNLNGFSVGSPESGLSSRLVIANPVGLDGKQPATGQPMFGKTGWTDAGQNVCLMVRALAKITVEVEPALLSPGERWADKTLKWKISGSPYQTSVETTYNPATKCYEIPDPTVYYSGWNTSNGVFGNLNVPLYSASYPNATVASGNQIVSKNRFSKGRTALMLSAEDNISGQTEYYRLDFSRQTRTTSLDYSAENEFLDIECNTHYTFRIRSVKSDGYTTYAEAWQNPGSNIEYTVDGSGYDGCSVTSNGQYGLLISEEKALVFNDISTPIPLLKFKLASSANGSFDLDTRTVALVGADKQTLIPTSQIQLQVGPGTPASSSGNSFDISNFSFFYPLELSYTSSSTLPSQEVYLRFVAGNITKYIPVGNYTFRVTPTSSNLPYTGGTASISVTSYSNASGSDQPEPWITEFSVDGGTTWSTTAPAWLHGFPAQGSGGKTAQNFSVTVDGQIQQYVNVHNDALKAQPAVTEYYLANSTGAKSVENTANCYVVNAPGTYLLPLIYGNAYKNGGPNPAAYTSAAASGTNVLSQFLDHTGAPITQGFIYTNYPPKDCCLVWQDADGLVTNVRLSSNGKNLEFEVPQATICQGNAVVAVRDASNRIAWSWHIWVTDYKLGTGLQTTTNYQGVTYNFLPYNIGWCDPSSYSYPARSVQVRFTQTSKGAQQIVTISQTAGPSSIISGNNPYFQWGRKDPMLPGLVSGSNGVDKSYFNSPGYAFGTSNLGTSINSYIQNPHLFNTSYYMDNRYYNLWSANNTVTSANDNVVVKTVYDPSPVGFCMPPSNAWTGFTTTGSNTGSASQIRGTWDSTVSPAGYNFDITGGTAYSPASGYRNFSSGALNFVGSGGCYWSAVPNATDYGRYLDFGAGGVSPLSSTRRSYGFPVRPVQE